eukprot:3636363-Prymnesium_polylepis.1
MPDCEGQQHHLVERKQVDVYEQRRGRIFHLDAPLHGRPGTACSRGTVVCAHCSHVPSPKQSARSRGVTLTFPYLMLCTCPSPAACTIRRFHKWASGWRVNVAVDRKERRHSEPYWNIWVALAVSARVAH